MASEASMDLDTERALVEWINSFALQHKIASLQELSDGRTLWQMLGNIDDEFFGGELPVDRATTIDSRQRNLKHVHDHAEQCLEYRGRAYREISDSDVGMIAARGGSPSVVKFIRMVLLVMLDSPRLPDLISVIQSLPENTQAVVGNLMQEMVQWDPDAVGEHDNIVQEIARDKSMVISSASTDLPDLRAEVLQLEEQYARIVSQLERRNRDYETLENELQVVSQSLAHSQETNDALRAQIADGDEHSRKQQSVQHGREHSSMRELESKISQQEETIAGNEVQLIKLQSLQAELTRERKKLTAANDELQRLQDEFDTNKVELEKQTRKANTADKYLQKLQAGQSLEKERDMLRQELEEARNSFKRIDRLRQENIALQKSNDETSRTLSQIEQEHEELRMTKKQLRIAYDCMNEQIEALNERFAQDQETIAELRERHVDPASPSSPRATDNLDGELLESSALEGETKSRSRDLERQVRNLTSEKTEKDDRIAALERQIDTLQLSTADQRVQLQKARQDGIALQTSLTQVQQGHPIEGTEVFKRMRDQVKAAETKHSQDEKELASLQSKLETLQKEHALLDGGKLQVLNELKKQANKDLIQSSLELEANSKQCALLQSELDKKTEEIELMKLKSNDLTKDDIAGLIQANFAGQSVESIGEALAGRLDSSRAKLVQQQEKLEIQDSTIEDLTAKLENASMSAAATSPESVKPEDRVYVTNLERELRLISSAFHNLAGRMAHNSIVVNRKADNPRNWLGRQRKAVEGLTGLAR